MLNKFYPPTLLFWVKGIIVYFTREQLSEKDVNKRFGQDLSEETRARIQSLSLPVLQKLTVDLLDFSSLADLQPWLEAQ